jgi:hypothetical protein
MSALGQKQTFAPQKAMSALPPIATEKADMCQWSCQLWAKSGHYRPGNYLLTLFAASNITPNTSFGLESIAT